MRRTAEARSAGFARKALFARKEKVAALAAGLRRGEDELHLGRRPDKLDRAADLETHDVVEAIQAAEARELAEIEAALQRLALGTYGKCERCGEPVGELRLRAIPHARLCMACAGIR
jgi:RNA polymerase-binding transcription factor DksA